MWDRDTGCPTHCFSLVVCRHQNRWLAVEEINNRGWWLPGGFVDATDESMAEAAVRETMEEAGVAVVLRGILRVEHSLNSHGARQRVIFYAEPKVPSDCTPKSAPDEESLGAAWLTLAEMKAKAKLAPPQGWRGTELLDWATYIENGGTVHPLHLFTSEGSPVPKSDRT